MAPTTEPPLPTFDARRFEPPAWAKDPMHAGTGTRSAASGGRSTDNNTKGMDDSDDFDDGASDATGPSTTVPPADLGVEEDDDGTGVRFTLDELKKLLAQGEKLKAEGNAHFTAKPQRAEAARDSYLAALDRLPVLPHDAAAEKVSGARIVALEEEERETTVASIRTCAKAVWGNLGAVYLVQGEHKEVVNACTKALEIDPDYVKALQRRASANESIDSWTSLTAAQEDYTRLVTLLPSTSPQLPSAKRTLAALPARIAVQQEKEKDEMLGKLKELGNGLLGKFGLSTDMFKFDEQPGGGYNLRFQR